MVRWDPVQGEYHRIGMVDQGPIHLAGAGRGEADGIGAAGRAEEPDDDGMVLRVVVIIAEGRPARLHDVGVWAEGGAAEFLEINILPIEAIGEPGAGAIGAAVAGELVDAPFAGEVGGACGGGEPGDEGKGT
jgi:hypothetical protein